MHTLFTKPSELTGPAPTWRPGFTSEDPIYRSVVADLGIPGQLTGPGRVVPGEVL